MDRKREHTIQEPFAYLMMEMRCAGTLLKLVLRRRAGRCGSTRQIAPSLQL